MASILYYVVAEGEPTEDADAEVAGTYALSLDDSFPEHDRVSAILDTFHCKVGISCLDDFTIYVTDAEGNALAEPEDAESYRFKDTAEFLGKSDRPATPPSNLA